jgi:hypothetical protein
MKTLFKVWLGLTILSLMVYSPLYFFADNPLDAVEELTPEGLMPHVGMVGQDTERLTTFLKRMRIDLDMELEDALDDTDGLSNVEIKYDYSDYARELGMATGLHVVKASAETGDNRTVELYFGVSPKTYLRSWAQVQGVLAVVVSDGEHSYNLLENSDFSNGMFLFTLFAEDDANRKKAIKEMVGTFNARLAREVEKPIPEPKPVVEEQVEHYAVQTQDEMVVSTPEPLGVVPQMAIEDVVVAEPSMEMPMRTESMESHNGAATAGTATVAGNPSPTQIIIFQWDGQPAYCSDQGIDGPVCSGDGSSFIGRGTYQDFMDEGSTICIAGEPDCQLPQYFDPDAKG